MVLPCHSSGTSPRAAKSCLTRSGLAPGKSILLIATMIGAPAALACSIASMVCGIIPSVADTTSTTISVAWAPRARIAVKASCPGVSKNVSVPRGVVTRYAPMCCVMAPASPATTLDLRIASKRLVLPWSTWPIMVITGLLGFKEAGSSGVSISATVSLLKSSSASSALKPHSSTISSNISFSNRWLIVAKMPIIINFLIKSLVLMFIFSANSFTVGCPTMRITFGSLAGASCTGA